MRLIMANYAANYAVFEAFAHFKSTRSFAIISFGSLITEKTGIYDQKHQIFC